MTDNKESTGKAGSSVEQNSEDGPADFERAIDTAGFGTFNILLLLAALPAAIAAVFESSVVSYILHSAECDLKLTLLDKGVLNAITYAGMITAAVFWGYLADTKGRKKILVFGYLADSVCVLGGALSQNVMHLMIFKYFGGFLICGPFAVLMSYLSELHGKKFRARVMMIVGIMFTTATLTLPLLALTILPKEWNFKVGELGFHSWQVFLAISAIPSVVGAVLLSLFPESPKFLMSGDRNAEALEVFRKMYAINHHKPRNSYPIKELKPEVPEKTSEPELTDSDATATIAIAIEGVKAKQVELETPKSGGDKRPKISFRQGLQQLRPLFTKPYLGLSLQVYLMNFAVLLGQNTVRLWLPQLFASITEFEQKSGGDTTSMCSALEYSVNKTAAVQRAAAIAEPNCEVIVTAASYTNNIIVALAGFVGYIIAGLVVNRLGSKHILTIGAMVAGACSVLLYFSLSALSTLIISAVFVTMGSISATSLISASVNLFPTSLRTMIVSLTMMFGHCGSVLGNVLFPAFMSMGCVPPFVMISFVMFAASILSAFLPNTNKTVLK